MLHVYWPPLAFVTLLLVLSVIIIMLRFGPQLCRTRHTALPDETEWREKTYEQRVNYESYA